MPIDKGFLIGLTNNLYRLTSLFPKKEPLRYKVREAADDVLAGFLSLQSPSQKESGSQQVLESLELLSSFLEIAKVQNWVSPSNILNFQKEYSKLKGELNLPESPIEQGLENVSNLPLFVRHNSEEGQVNRQEKILEFLKGKGKAQVWELKQVFPEVSKRTLRRDFESLLKRGIVERIGERNDTFYQVNPAPFEHKSR